MPRPARSSSSSTAMATVSPGARPASQTITVTPEFQHVLKLLKSGYNVLIQGSAGTGKSTFLRWLRRQLAGSGKAKTSDDAPSGKKLANFAVLAPTGLAALNVGGQTIHSFFRFPTSLLTPDVLRPPRQPKLFKNLQLLIVDEISMVRADVLDAMDIYLRQYGPDRTKAFGGVQLMLMGDLFQLPPVLTRDEEPYFPYDTPYFFSSNAYRSGNFQPVEFTHIFRQTDPEFIDMLNRVRHGHTSRELLDTLNQRLASRHNADEVEKQVTLAARVALVEERNASALEALPGQAHTYTAVTKGDFDLKSPPSPANLVLRVGARVMFTRNHPQGEWVNGTLGTVTACKRDYVSVRADNGEELVVEPISWEMTRYTADDGTSPVTDVKTATDQPALFATEVAGSYTQLPLTLAWALTIHKAQGQTLPGCLVDLGTRGAFAEGQLYVALSRARSLSQLYLQHPLTARDLRTHPAVRDFYQYVFR